VALLPCMLCYACYAMLWVRRSVLFRDAAAARGCLVALWPCFFVALLPVLQSK